MSNLHLSSNQKNYVFLLIRTTISYDTPKG